MLLQETRFNQLPLNLQQLVCDPCFEEISFKDLNIQTVLKAVRIVKTKTLLATLQPPQIILSKQETQKNKPIILVFCQPSEELHIGNGEICPYVAASYCSWIQSVGAQCVPLPYDLNEGSIQMLLQKSHGLILPGGGSNLYANFAQKEGCGPIMIGFSKVWRHLNKMWGKGVEYPVWATCLGLEMVLLALSGDTKILSSLNSRGHQVEIYSDYSNSRLFGPMPNEYRVLLEHRPLLNFAHSYGISLHKFCNHAKLKEKLKIVSVSQDKDKKWFCSFLEGHCVPLFLSQFHPQKQAFQWTLKGDILHTNQAVAISNFLAHRFVSFSRLLLRNRNFSQQEIKNYTILKYRPLFFKEKMYKVFAIQYNYREKEKDNQKRNTVKDREISLKKI